MPDKERKIPGICLLLILIALVIIPFSCFVYLPYWVMESPPVKQSAADRVKVGLSKAEVRSILGEPSQTHMYDEGRENWVYSHKFQWQYYTVYFSEDGKVIDSELDR